VDVQHLPIATAAADNGGHDDELVLGDEVADAAFLAGRFGAWVCLDVELEG